ncbi:MAG: WecB/TagA/CpsF family glycosyltransferase [Syntrophomonadaceae bacterium]|nr:WecB/TagA/CpsF family glycosyltransferase [Syntrophomonadaceae bacterium]
MSFEYEQAQVLGCRLDVVDMAGAMKLAEDMIRKRLPSQIVTLNAEMIYRAQESPQLKEIYARARLVTPDGIGAIWALRRQGYDISKRVTGVALTYKILKLAEEQGLSVYLLGGRPGVAQEVAGILMNPPHRVKVAGNHHGYFIDDESLEIVELIRAAQPDILLVGLGAPRQDQWIAQYLEDLRVPVCIGVGGTLDVLAGRVKRAPRIWRRLGLEWLYRLVSEPARIKRQMALPKFVGLVLKQGRKKAGQSLPNR